MTKSKDDDNARRYTVFDDITPPAPSLTIAGSAGKDLAFDPAQVQDTVMFIARNSIYGKMPPKSRGQLAYEADLKQWPKYDDGTPRKTWAQLPEYARRSWEKNATPRVADDKIEMCPACYFVSMKTDEACPHCGLNKKEWKK